MGSVKGAGKGVAIGVLVHLVLGNRKPNCMLSFAAHALAYISPHFCRVARVGKFLHFVARAGIAFPCITRHHIHFLQGRYHRAPFLYIWRIARKMMIPPYFFLAHCIDIFESVSNVAIINVELCLQEYVLSTRFQF